MAEIEIELDAYVIPDDHRIWKCFPGETYRFFEIVRDAKTVFLDVRGLEELVADPQSWSDDEALELIAKDRWDRQLAKPEVSRKGRPDISPVDRRTLTFLKGLLFDAKKGDLIVLPPEAYRREVLIGELLDDAGRIYPHRANDRGREFTYLGRRVRWRPTQEKRFFSRDLIDLLHTQAAFFLLPQPLYEEIYRIAYANFVLRDSVFVATFETTKERFTTSDGAVVGAWFNALAAARDAVEGGGDLGRKTYLEIALTPTANAREGEMAININSPGQYLIRSVGSFALVVMAMLPLSEVPAAEILASPITIKLNAVGSATSACALKIPKDIEDYAKTLAVQRLQQHCEIGQRARDEATLKTKARLKHTHGRPT